MPKKTRKYLPTSENQYWDYDRFGKSKESDPIDFLFDDALDSIQAAIDPTNWCKTLPRQ